MKTKYFPSYLIMVVLLFAQWTLFAQRAKIDTAALIRNTKAERLPEQVLASSFKELQRNDGWRLLTNKMTSLNFSPKSEPASMFGQKVTVTGGGSRPAMVQIFHFGKADKKETAWMIHITDGKEVYDALIIVKDTKVWGDTTTLSTGMEEWMLEGIGKNQKVVPARSWSKCMKRHLRDATAGCASSLVGCLSTAVSGPFMPGTYWGCVAVACGAQYTFWSAWCALPSWMR